MGTVAVAMVFLHGGNMQVEVYYGFYEGDAQMWDTIYIDMPKMIPKTTKTSIYEEDLANFIMGQAKLELQRQNIAYVFLGVLNVTEVES